MDNISTISLKDSNAEKITFQEENRKSVIILTSKNSTKKYYRQYFKNDAHWIEYRQKINLSLSKNLDNFKNVI